MTQHPPAPAHRRWRPQFARAERAAQPRAGLPAHVRYALGRERARACDAARARRRAPSGLPPAREPDDRRVGALPGARCARALLGRRDDQPARRRGRLPRRALRRDRTARRGAPAALGGRRRPLHPARSHRRRRLVHQDARLPARRDLLASARRPRLRADAEPLAAPEPRRPLGRAHAGAAGRRQEGPRHGDAAVAQAGLGRPGHAGWPRASSRSSRSGLQRSGRTAARTARP